MYIHNNHCHRVIAHLQSFALSYIYTYINIYTYIYIYIYGKAVPLEARRTPVGSGKFRFPDFVKTAQEVGKVVSLSHRPPLTSGNAPGTPGAIGRNLSMKNTLTPVWIETATFRFAAQCLHHGATTVPMFTSIL